MSYTVKSNQLQATQSMHSKKNSALACLRISIAFLLVAWFLLPNTVFAQLSPWYFVEKWSARTLYATDHLVIVAFALLTFALFYFRGESSERGGGGKVPMWLPLACYLAPMIATLLLPTRFQNLVVGVEAMTVAICTGLLATLICGSSRRALIAICLVATLQALFTIFYHKHNINELISGDVSRAGGTFNDPYGVCVLMLAVIPVAIAGMLSSTSLIEKNVSVLICSLCVAALILTWTRGAILGLVIGAIWLVAKLVQKRSIVLGIAVVLIALYCFTASHRTANITDQLSSGRSVVGRESLWRTGITIFRENWLTGVGIGALYIPTHRYGGSVEKEQLDINGEPKNLILDWLDELGIGGGIILVLFVISIRNRITASDDKIEGIGVAAAWICLLVASMFDTSFGTVTRYHGNTVAGFFLGATQLLVVNGRSTSKLANEVPECKLPSNLEPSV